MSRIVRLCSFVLAALTLAVCTSAPLAAQCYPAWLYRVPITINNSANPNTLANYQVLINFNTQTPIAQSKMRADGGDIRFALDPNGSCTNVCYWIESGLNSSFTRIWVKLPSISGSSSTTLYMFYGNTAATSTADPLCVFDLFDDFTGNSLDGSKWQQYGPGTVVVNGGTCTFTTPPGSSACIRSVAGTPGPVISEAMVTSASGNWPNLCQQLGTSWNGYGPMMSSSTIRIGWTSANGQDYAGNWTVGDAATNTATGVWQFIWAATGDQRFNWPGGSLTTTYNNFTLSGNINIALGLLESGSGSMTVDWVRVRKYANPDVSVLIGAEENVTPPVITQQPTSQALCQGGTVTFTVAATGPALTYQWRKNTVPIVGATGTSYTIVNVQPIDGGVYDCVVRSQTTTNPATLTVYTPPGIVTDPSSILQCPGAPATFKVEGTGTGLTYQWRKDGIDIPGATSPVLVIPVAMPADGGSYDCAVSGLCGGPIYSGAATLTLRAQPTIVSSTGDQTVCRGQIATFMVVVTGENLTFQWRKDGVPLEGATKATLNIMAQPYSAGNYDVIVSGSCPPAVTSTPAHLTVNLDPIITEQPLDQTLDLGRTVVYQIRVIGGGIISYQWYKDGVAMPGRTHDTLIIQNVAPSDIAEYYCVVRGTVCSDRELVVSDKASLILNVTPAIIKDPQNTSVCEGSTLTLSVTAAGLGLRYQWRKGGVNIPGATNRDLTINTAVVTDAGSYDCVITSPGTPTPLTSGAATVTVNQPASIATQPTDVMVCPGKPAQFSVAATGANLTYQWFKDGQPKTGETNSSLAITSVSAADTGVYTVAVNGSCLDSALESHTARLILNELPAITGQPQPSTGVPRNGTVTLMVTATGTNLTYQWYKDGVLIPGATTATYTITNAQPEQSGEYSCLVSGTCEPAAASDTVSVQINTLGVPNDPAMAGAALTVIPQPAVGLTKLVVRVPQGVTMRTGTEFGLYDVKGTLVLNLSEAFERGGFRTAEFNAAALPSGTYYCRVTAGAWTGTLGSVMVVK